MIYSVIGFTKNKYGKLEGGDVYATESQLHGAVEFAKDLIRCGQVEAISIHEREDDGKELCRVWTMGKTLTLEEVY